MQKSILVHNPRCSKSREALSILNESGIEFDTIDYLKDGLKEKLLSHLPKLLGMNFSEMIRTKEDVYKELNLSSKKLSDAEWIKILMKHPILLERPIFIHGDKAVIARPAELLKKII